MGTGTLGSTSFTDAEFAIVILADTDDIQTLNASTIAVNNLSTTVRVGTTTAVGLAGSTYSNSFGFFYYVGGPIGTDFEDAPLLLENAAFGSYDLASPLGPLSIPSNKFRAFVSTDLGPLSFQSVSRASFRAAIVPEPASLTLTASGGILLLATAWRRRGRPRR